MGRTKPLHDGAPRHSTEYHGNSAIRARAREMLQTRIEEGERLGHPTDRIPRQLCKLGRRMTKRRIIGGIV